MTRPIINPGTIEWSGEHWISYLGRRGDASNSAIVSLYHTRYSAAGEGTVALVDVTGEPGFRGGVCTDSRELEEFVIDKLVAGSGNPWADGFPVLDAEFARDGAIREAPSWTIQAGADRILVTWSSIRPPLIVEGDSLTFTEGVDFFTLLFFAEESSISLNGRPSEGGSYQVESWDRALGGG